jgi:hypothetical protein
MPKPDINLIRTRLKVAQMMIKGLEDAQTYGQ